MKPRPASYSNEATRDMSQFLGIANKMGICQIFFLIVDIACNFIVDGFSSDPMIGFILFIIQVLGILTNLISFLMISSHEAIQNVFVRSKTSIHNLNAVIILSYLSLTTSWFIWSLRRSWPAAGDQFSYSFLPKSNSSANNSAILPFGSGFSNLKDDREFYTLWSAGFIALYTAQRTVALLYYGVHLQSIFLLMNSTAPQVNKPTEKLKMRTISAFVGTKESITSGRNSQLERYNISPSKEYASFPQFPGKGDLTSGAQKTNIDPIGRRDSNSTTTTGSRSGRRRKQSSGEKFRNLNISS